MLRIDRRCLIAVLVFVTAYIGANAQKNPAISYVDKLDEDNWDRMLVGEWMIEFYAPWCPSCKALEPIWESLATQKKELGINVGKVDVTDAPGLSGRFMVTALPTIYHVKDGLFRQYKSPRDKDSLVEFVAHKTWMKVDPVSSWKSPTSIHMSIISQFYKMSQVLRGIHNKLQEDFGLPTWGCYLIFAIATIVLGAVLGLLIVLIIDFIYPPMQPSRAMLPGKHRGDKAAKESDEDELVDGVKDDLVDEEGSDSDGKSDNDKTDSGKDKDSKSLPNSPNVRKRRARKAD